MTIGTRALTRANDGLLAENIWAARNAHAEKLAAIGNIHDASILRLQVLRDELVPHFENNPKARGIVDLVLVPGHPPRLWIDMTSYVLMAPDPSTYRVQRDSFCGHDVLHESTSRSAAIAAVIRHVAHHLVEREKQLMLSASDAADTGSDVYPYSVMLVWLCGLTFGFCLFVALMQWLGR